MGISDDPLRQRLRGENAALTIDPLTERNPSACGYAHPEFFQAMML